MELSRQKITEAKKLGVTVQYMVMADLMAVGYNEEDAYTLAFPENTMLSVKQNKGIRTNITESAKFRRLAEERRNRVKEGMATPSTLDDLELVGTEEVLKEILRSARQQPVGSKERADLYAKYNDIRKDSDAGIEDDTERINFYLPMKCDRCPLLTAYNEYARKKGGTEVQPVDMGRVLRLAQTIIQAATDAQ